MQAPMYDATSFNSQRGNADNDRKARQIEQAQRLGSTFFISEMQSSFIAPPGSQVVSATGSAIPRGGLNYLVPTGSTLYYPTLPADVVGGLQSVGRPSSYEGLWKHPVRYPVNIGVVNNTTVYGIHSKSAPSLNAQYALAGMILDFVDNTGGQWALIGDLNLEPDVLKQRLEELRPGCTAALYFVGLGRATQRSGGELDYVVTNVPNVDVQQISRMNLRRGSDHSGIGINF
ncbi:MAG TPA: hypothetical protein VKV17_16650 [Bryobacteraceae bacterium]|nr:hypothetical protein [Bryobacteraceae bacterium]